LDVYFRFVRHNFCTRYPCHHRPGFSVSGIVTVQVSSWSRSFSFVY